MFGQADVVLDPLVRNDAADEQEIQQSVGEHSLERRPRRRHPDPIGIDGDREDAGVGEAQVVELLLVVSGVAQGDLGVPGEGREFLAAERGQPEDGGVVGREEFRRRHVVVLQHPSARQLAERGGHR